MRKCFLFAVIFSLLLSITAVCAEIQNFPISFIIDSLPLVGKNEIYYNINGKTDTVNSMSEVSENMSFASNNFIDLYSDGLMIYRLNASDDTLEVKENGKWLIANKLPDGTISNVEGIDKASNFIMEGNLIYFILPYGNEGTNILYMLNLSSGTLKPLCYNCVELTPWNDTILVLLHQLGDSGKRINTVCSVNSNGIISSPVYTTLIIDCFGLASSFGTCDFFIANGTALVHCTEKNNKWSETEITSIAPTNILANSKCISYRAGNYYCQCRIDLQGKIQLTIYNTLSEFQSEKLKISGIYSPNNCDAAYMFSHPEVSLLRSGESHFCAQELYSLMNSGSADADIYCLRMDWDLYALMRKGYLEPLLFTFFSDLYNQYVEVCKIGSNVFALPESISLSVFLKNEELFQNDKDELTLMNLLENAICYENGAYISGMTKKTMSDFIIQQYIFFCQSKNIIPTFKHSEFLKLVETLAKVHDNRFSSDAADSSCPVYYGSRGFSSMGYSNKYTYIENLSLWENEKLHYFPRMTVYVINRNSDHKDIAMKYLDFVTKNRRPQDKAYLEKTCIEIPSAFNENNQQKFLVSDSALQEYREVVLPLVAFPKEENPFPVDMYQVHPGVFQSLSNALAKYLAGSVSLEQAINEMRHIVQSAYMELK